MTKNWNKLTENEKIEMFLDGIKELHEGEKWTLRKRAEENKDEALPLDSNFSKLTEFTHEVLTRLHKRVIDLEKKREQK